MSVKAEAVSPLCLDVVNDAVAVSPHKEENAAVDGPVHPCADLADGFARWRRRAELEAEDPHVRNECVRRHGRWGRASEARAGCRPADGQKCRDNSEWPNSDAT
jgi:hypothetical protein